MSDTSNDVPVIAVVDPLDVLIADAQAIRALHEASAVANAAQAAGQAKLDATKATMAAVVAAQQVLVDADATALAALTTAAALAHSAIKGGADKVVADAIALRDAP